MKDALVEHFPYTSHPQHKAAARRFLRKRGRKGAAHVRKMIRRQSGAKGPSKY